jgi:DNA-binding MarR family transcriptional regulator
MVDRGLVTKEPCPSDLRGHYVVITARGVGESRRVAPGHVDDVRRNFFDHLSSSQQQQLQQLSEKILTYLHAS